MLDFKAVRDGKTTLNTLAGGLKVQDLKEITNEMIDAMQALLSDCTDEAVLFVPDDPESNDPYAVDAAEANQPWTLGHVIVHTTASSEESAALAVELARGVKYHGRSRSEVPWQSIQTNQQCLQRLEESRRMRIASLDMWPDIPFLDNTYDVGYLGKPVHAVVRFLMGLNHDDIHLGQMAEIVRQAKSAGA